MDSFNYNEGKITFNILYFGLNCDYLLSTKKFKLNQKIKQPLYNNIRQTLMEYRLNKIFDCITVFSNPQISFLSLSRKQILIKKKISKIKDCIRFPIQFILSRKISTRKRRYLVCLVLLLNYTFKKN